MNACAHHHPCAILICFFVAPTHVCAPNPAVCIHNSGILSMLSQRLKELLLQAAAQVERPLIYRYDVVEPGMLAELPDWRTVTIIKAHPPASRAHPGAVKPRQGGRGFTSKFRGVHQTFPTGRWEAQFRRNGKPTSLGCFNTEEDAARAYDKMTLWGQLHSTRVGKSAGHTNFDPADYDQDLPLLQQMTQDDLLEELRSIGRSQAAAQRVPSRNRKRARGRDDDD